MIINKSQVQSLKNVGIYLPSLLFSSDKFYVAISRVISRNGLKILITDEDGKDIDVTFNVVYTKVFRKVM